MVDARGTVAVAVATLLVACGRFGFDATGQRDGSVADDGGGPADGSTASDGGAGAVPDANPSACAEPSPASLAVHLRFDEAGGDLAADASGNGNDGAVLGGPDTEWVTGQIGNALDFDGDDDRVNAGSAGSVDDLTTMTMCAWIYPRSYPSNFPTIADKSVDSFVGGWFFYIQDNDTVGFQSNQRKWVIGGALALDAWQHACASWDGSDGYAGIRLYLDGVEVAHRDQGSNGNATDSDAVRDLVIGRVNNGAFPFDGVIDDYRLYGRVLSSAEIAALYACGSSGS